MFFGLSRDEPTYSIEVEALIELMRKERIRMEHGAYLVYTQVPG
jgi:hypothetical protein